MLKGIRKATKSMFEHSMRARARALTRVELDRDAWVVAPHPDDETLGCGGTILEKRRRDARVRVAFVSDGSGSHTRWISPEELGARRRDEARRACERLGVPGKDVFFLGLPDDALSEHVAEGASALSELFSQHPARQFFVPHRLEPPLDHSAATAMALGGLRESGASGVVFQYPVWMWSKWPWVPWSNDPSALEGRSRQPSLLFDGIRRNLEELRCRVDVRSHIAAKREALSQHATQMSRPADTPDWPILEDFANGEFLELFFSGWEYFHRSAVPGR